MWSERLLSTEWWTKIFSILALGGLVTSGVGFALGSKGVVVAGLALCAPLVLGGVLALLVGLPYIYWTDPRRRRERKGK
jgi:hypothetical protein